AAGPPAANDVGSLGGHDLTALVAGSLDRLAPPARRLVEALAVLDRPAAAPELAALVDDSAAAVWASALEARAAGFVDSDEAGRRGTARRAGPRRSAHACR